MGSIYLLCDVGSRLVGCQWTAMSVIFTPHEPCETMTAVGRPQPVAFSIVPAMSKWCRADYPAFVFH